MALLAGIDLVPASVTVLNTLPDGGTYGDNAMSTLAWFLEEAGGKSLGAANDRNNFFLIDAYLHQDTELRFTLTCAC